MKVQVPVDSAFLGNGIYHTKQRSCFHQFYWDTKSLGFSFSDLVAIGAVAILVGIC
jgi:hypothetical protein